jgi:hypothetical protein
MAANKTPALPAYKVLANFMFKHGVYTIGQELDFSKADAQILLGRGVIKLNTEGK